MVAIPSKNNSKAIQLEFPVSKKLHANCSMHGQDYMFQFEPGAHAHCKKGFVILTIVLLTRIATADMVLWDDTRMVPCDSNTVHME